ncbi:hypothetical protein ACHWQZ_G001795 [Mnemiopsis leidyi]
MANESQWSPWNNHQAYTFDFLGVGPSIEVDTFLGVVLVLCGVIGFLANVLSFIYFINRTTTNISLKLYSVISLTDSITCLLIIAVAKVLFEERDPGWFENINFCKFWAISYEIACQYSLFLVTMISVTRAITITRPQFRINVTAVKIALVIHPVEYLLERAVGTHVAVRDVYGFSVDDPTCWVTSQLKSVHIVHQILIAAKVGVASIATFIAFTASIAKLGKSKKTGSMEKIYRASVTIAIFTLVFLVCNLPYFLNMLVYAISMYLTHPDYPPGVYKKYFMYYYSFPVSKVVFITLNAACNPILYICRMTDFQKWIKEIVHRVNIARISQTVSTSMGGETQKLYKDSRCECHEMKPLTDNKRALNNSYSVATPMT